MVVWRRIIAEVTSSFSTSSKRCATGSARRKSGGFDADVDGGEAGSGFVVGARAVVDSSSSSVASESSSRTTFFFSLLEETGSNRAIFLASPSTLAPAAEVEARDHSFASSCIALSVRFFLSAFPFGGT